MYVGDGGREGGGGGGGKTGDHTIISYPISSELHICDIPNTHTVQLLCSYGPSVSHNQYNLNYSVL